MRSKYVYFGKNPTNVCFNGVSLPVMPGDVLKCHAEFIHTQIPEAQYKVVAPGSPADKRPIKHDLGHQPFFIKKDPLGGLPIRTNPDAGPHLANPKFPRAVSPALIDETEVDNPYAMPKGSAADEDIEKEADEITKTPAGIPPRESLEDNMKLELTTVPEIPAAPEPPADPLVIGRDHYMEDKGFDLGDSEDEDENDEGEEEALDTSEDEEGEDDEEILDDSAVEEPLKELLTTVWGRSELRKKTRDEIFEVTQVIKAEGCPLNPAMVDAFIEFDDSSTRGVMFQTIWEYHGFNN